MNIYTINNNDGYRTETIMYKQNEHMTPDTMKFLLSKRLHNNNITVVQSSTNPLQWYYQTEREEKTNALLLYFLRYCCCTVRT